MVDGGGREPGLDADLVEPDMRARLAYNAAFLKDVEICAIEPRSRRSGEKHSGPEKPRAQELDTCLVILDKQTARPLQFDQGIPKFLGRVC